MEKLEGYERFCKNFIICDLEIWKHTSINKWEFIDDFVKEIDLLTCDIELSKKYLILWWDNINAFIKYYEYTYGANELKIMPFGNECAFMELMVIEKVSQILEYELYNYDDEIYLTSKIVQEIQENLMDRKRD